MTRKIEFEFLQSSENINDLSLHTILRFLQAKHNVPDLQPQMTSSTPSLFCTVTIHSSSPFGRVRGPFFTMMVMTS